MTARLREVHVRCIHCGTTLSPGEGTCPTCGTAIEQATAYALTPAQTAYEPGPSFVDVAALPLDTSEMPSWLEAFGASVAADGASDNSVNLESERPSFTGSAEPTLPNWLSEPRPGVPVEPVVADLPWDTDEVSADTTAPNTGFISEDDLPEWLRAISGDVAAEPTHAMDVAPAAAANGGFPVPAVVQAWVIAHQMVALASGESLMAHLATSEESRAEAPSSEPTPASSTPPSVDLMPRSESSSAPASDARRMRIVLLVLVIAALLLLFVLYRTAA